MNKNLVVYDETGYVIQIFSGEVREPIGVPFLWTDVPRNKYVESVDVSNETHVPNFVDFPKTDIEQLRLETARANTELFEMMLMMNGGA